MSFQIIRNDITKVKADVIVNTANLSVAVGDGVDRAIYEAAGWEKLLAERQKIGELPVGEVAISPAFRLSAKYIIHCSGPWWEGGLHGEAGLLRQCYDRALELAYKHQCRSIAFPLMATGTYGFPKETGLQIAVDAFRNFLEEHEMDISLVVFPDYAYKISGDLYENVVNFTDELAAEHAPAPECKREDISDDFVLYEAAEEPKDAKPPAPVSKRPLFNRAASKADSVDRCVSRESSADRCASRADSVAGSASTADSDLTAGSAFKEKRSLDKVLRGIYTDSFEKHLNKLINKKGLKNSEVYAAANISKQYFSKLMKGKVKPSKEKVLALAVGLHLNLDETVDFLKLAGYALSPISQTDAVVEYFIENKVYNVLMIDIVLFDYGLEPLSKG